MPMQFRHIEPHFLLKKYIRKMWIFESSGRIPVDDMNWLYRMEILNLLFLIIME